MSNALRRRLKRADRQCNLVSIVADIRATLENVVVGSFATLGEDCNLKDCEVSYGATVGKGRT